MYTFSRDIMAEETSMVRQLVREARTVPAREWPAWVTQNKDRVRLSGADDYIPEQEDWIKRCESFLACIASPLPVPDRAGILRQANSFIEPDREENGPNRARQERTDAP